MSDYEKPQTIRVSLDAVAIRPVKRGPPWMISSGRWEAQGASEKEARDSLAQGLGVFLAEFRPPLVLTFRGYVAVVSLELGDSYRRLNWCVETAGPGGRRGSRYCGGESWEEVEASARHNIAQVSTDWHDDTSVQEGAAYVAGFEQVGYGQYGPEEFFRYASWQRAARAARDAGRQDWHEWATENAKHFPIPRVES